MLRLVLHAGPERLAVPVAAVAEVLPAVERHPPGVIVHRGAVLPVLDVVKLVSGRDCPATLHARIVVVEKPAPLGLLVERVGELREFPAAEGSGDSSGLGPLVADADGVIRLTDPARLGPP